MDAVTYALCKKFALKVAAGFSAVKVDEPNCAIIFTLNDGKQATLRIPKPKDGLSVKNLEIQTGPDGKQYLICTLSDDSIINVGEFPSTTFTGVAGISLGGVKQGEVFKNEPIEKVIAKLLSPPYAKPKITIGINPTTVLYDIEEDTVNTLTISANVTKTTEDIKYVKFYVDTKVVQTIEENVKNGGVFKSPQTFDPPLKETFDVKVETCDIDTQSIVSATTKIKFIGKTYYGIIPEGTTIDEDAIRGLNSLLKDSKGYTYDGITTPGTDLYHIVFAQPASYGAISSIIDGMNFEYIQDYTSATMTFGEGDDAIEYNVVYLTEPASVADFMQKFS